MFLSGCEKPAQTKDPEPAKGIVSRPIVFPLPEKSEVKPLQGKSLDQTLEQISEQGSDPPGQAEGIAEETLQVPAGQVPEALVLQEEAAVGSAPGKIDPGEQRSVYDPKGRVDPFVSLIQEKEEKSETGPVVEEQPERMLTPLEKLDLAQIKLVAIVLMKNRRLAMVEEATGKGYEITIGTYLGKNSGQVSQINPSSIVVKDYVTDFKGNRLERLQEIKLHKKEDGE